MKIRRAYLKDTAALAAVECTQPQAAGWGKAGFENELKQTCAVILCAQEASQIVGFIAARYVMESAEILNIAVHADWLRCGTGRNLLSEMFEVLKQAGVRFITLEVARDNAAACRLYQAAGFKVVNIRKDFYAAGRDAWLLKKIL